MKTKPFIFTATVLTALMGASPVATAASISFSTAPIDFLVSEAHGPTNVPATPYSGTINYTPGLWNSGGVNSATLTIYLSDDLSSNFPGMIDAPREWASLTSVTDGSSSNFLASPMDVEVDPQPFVPSDIPSSVTNLTGLPAQQLVDAATNAGIENPSVAPSAAGYFNLDIAPLLNASNSGSLNFALEALSNYADLNGGLAYSLIKAIIGDPTSTTPYYVIEDYLFKYAEITVDYNEIPQTVPAPPAFWLMALGLMSLFGMRKVKK